MRSKVWVWVVVIAVILGGWYLLSSYGAKQAVAPSPQVPNSITGNLNPSTKPAASASGNAGINGSLNQTNTGQAKVAPVVTLSSNQELGQFLLAANGMTLYTYNKDTTNTSNCTGSCIKNWPAYTPKANEPLMAGIGITGTLSTITRADGTIQLTYKGKPLYFWNKDVKVGDTLGNNTNGFFVAKP